MWRPSERSTGTRRPGGSPLLVAALAGLLAGTLLLCGCGPPAPPSPSLGTARSPAPPPPAPRPGDPAPATGDALAMADDGAPNDVQAFERHALNALLAPLLDDDEPPRWVAPHADFGCGDTATVTVDGGPLVPGTPVPRGSFQMRWRMNGCRPLGRDGPELSGIVDLSVYRADEALGAWVSPHAVHFLHDGHRHVLDTPFAARLLLHAPAAGRP